MARRTDNTLVQVRALMPLWADNEVVAAGTVYGLPVGAAAALAQKGMVELLDSVTPTVHEPTPEPEPAAEDEIDWVVAPEVD